jgi:site-specific recombinase XerD
VDNEGFRVFLLVHEGKSQFTVRVMMDALARAVEMGFNPDMFASGLEAARQEGARLLARLRARDSPNPYNSAQKMLNALARYSRYQELHFPKLPERPPQPKTYRDWELERVLSYRNPRRGRLAREDEARRRALVWCSHFMGARRGELHRLNVDDLDPLHCTFTIRKPSKLGPPRTLPAEPELFSPRRPLMAWLRQRPVPSMDPDALWTRTLRDGRVKRLTYGDLTRDLWEISRTTGVRVNFVRGRHQRATTMLRAGVQLPYIRDYLGHRNITTTARYAETTPEDLRAALQRSRPRSPIKRRRTPE